MTPKQLIAEAKEAQKMSYSPYSHFEVGAALLTKSGKIYYGCNIENAAYTPCNCAERTAFFKAVSEGEKEFTSIAIVGNKNGTQPEKGEFCTPCGVCRQVMAEFCNPKEFMIFVTDGYTIKEYRLDELLPQSFGPGNLQ